MRRALGLIITVGCAGHAAPPAPRADRPRLTPTFVAALAADPAGLARVVAPAHGLVDVQLLGCEREPLERARHLCGDDVAAAAGALHQRLARAAREAGADAAPPDHGITCDADLRCQIPATSECDPAYQLRFVDDPVRGPVLIGVVERDDWQHPDSPEVEAELRRVAATIEAAFAAAVAGCR